MLIKTQNSCNARPLIDKKRFSASTDQQRQTALLGSTSGTVTVAVTNDSDPQILLGFEKRS